MLELQQINTRVKTMSKFSFSQTLFYKNQEPINTLALIAFARPSSVCQMKSAVLM